MIVEVTAHKDKWAQMKSWLDENMPGRWFASEPIGSIMRDVEFENERDVTLFMLRWNSK